MFSYSILDDDKGFHFTLVISLELVSYTDRLCGDNKDVNIIISLPLSSGLYIDPNDFSRVSMHYYFCNFLFSCALISY